MRGNIREMLDQKILGCELWSQESEEAEGNVSCTSVLGNLTQDGVEMGPKVHHKECKRARRDTRQTLEAM